MELNEQKQEVIESIKEYLNRLIPGIEETVVLLRMADDNKAMKNLTDIFEGLDWLLQASYLTADVIPETIDIASVNSLMKEISEGMENSDYVIVADLFEYEILPKLIEWSEKLK